MTKSKRVMRKLILSKLHELLRDQSTALYPTEIRFDEELSLHELDALLAFKSDPRLEELRHALDRLENGTYGICIGCKSPITQEVLDKDPAQRVCQRCEERLVHMEFHHTRTERPQPDVVSL